MFHRIKVLYRYYYEHNANNISEIVSSDGIFVDLSAPQVSEVFDGENNNDNDWQSSDSSLSISWLPADTINIYIYWPKYL